MQNKKLIIIFSITLIGTITGLLIWYFAKASFLHTPTDTFMDYFNTIKVLDNVYLEVGIGRGYFPFTYVILNIIKFLFGIDIYGYSNLITIFLLLFMFFMIKSFKENYWKSFILFF